MTHSPTRPRTPLRLSANRRYLVDADGLPFLYVGDTAWAVVWKGGPEQWQTYLDRRQSQGFSVVQVNLLPWRWEMTDAEGNRPFHDGDPDRPNEAYFARFDRFLALAAEHGLVTCLMLIWGGPRPDLPAVHFSTEQAVRFARWAVERFTRYPMIWSVSGDAPYDEEPEKWDAVGRAVQDADPNGHPTTNHLMTGRAWRFLHHDAPWHDFHMIQTGHYEPARPNVADLAAAYYRAEPIKAYVNGEPWYEAHPDMTNRPTYGPLFTAEHVRYAFWVSVLSGATMGHTYGGQGIWNWKRPGDSEVQMAGPQIGPTWEQALELPGAQHCADAAAFFRSQRWHDLQPAPERVRSASRETPRERQPACAILPGARWIVYLPAAPSDPSDSSHLPVDRTAPTDSATPRGPATPPTNPASVLLLGVEADTWRARWLDPRTGAEHKIGPVDVSPEGIWPSPPRPGSDDWVLILDAEER